MIIEDEDYLPFEGILGDTPELRIIQFLMATSWPEPLKFSAKDLMEAIPLSEAQLNASMINLVPWGVINMEFSKEEQCFLYWMEPDNEYTIVFQIFNNIIIEKILAGLHNEEMNEE